MKKRSEQREDDIKKRQGEVLLRKVEEGVRFCKTQRGEEFNLNWESKSGYHAISASNPIRYRPGVGEAHK